MLQIYGMIFGGIAIMMVTLVVLCFIEDYESEKRKRK